MHYLIYFDMTNAGKAKDILNCKHCMLGEKICFKSNETPCVYYRDIIKMAQWKDEQHAQEKQQWIDKACKWFKNHAEDFIDDEGGTIMPYIEDECFVRLKKAMEDEL